MTVIPLHPARCTQAEEGDGTPCDDWPKCDWSCHRHAALPVQPREQSVRCHRCFDTDTWNASGFCDACEAWRARVEKSTAPEAERSSDGARLLGSGLSASESFGDGAA